MPRTGPNGEYTLPPNTNDQQPNATIRSSMFNGFATDVQQALNTEWPAGLLPEIPEDKIPEITADKLPIVPIEKGGTGGETLEEAQENLGILSANYTLMSMRTSLIVNGSLIDSQENGNTLGTSNGYFAADQFALYFTAATAAMSIQRIESRTLAGSAHKLEFKATTAKTTLGATDYVSISQPIEGSQPEFIAAGWGAAGAKPFVFRFEFSAPAGLYHVHATNSAANRHIAIPFTVEPADAGVAKVYEVVIPGDTSGTWLIGEGTIGVLLDIVEAAGSSLTGGSASTWGGTTYYAATTQKNILDSTSNVVRVGDFGLRLDPDATGVYGRYGVGEVDPVYQSERYALALALYPLGRAASNNRLYTGIVPIKMCKVPTLASGATFTVDGGSAGTPALNSIVGWATTNAAASFFSSSAVWTSNSSIAVTCVLLSRLS
jgi:hypothetical protein